MGNFDIELHELVKVIDSNSEYHGQAGNVRAIDENLSEPYLMEFEGKRGMPSFARRQLEKIVPTPTQNFVVEEGVMFKQDDTVQTTVCRTSHDGEILIGVGSIGLVTVVGIDVQDGCCNGIEVLFEGKTYGHYKPSELAHAAGNPLHDFLKDAQQAFKYKPEDRPAELKKFRTDDPLRMARELVHQLYYSKTGLPLEDVYIVWFCSAVQNWKALVSTNVRDNCYYEVTHNGAKNETYVDRYIKLINAVYHHNTGLVDLTTNPDVHI